MCSNPVNVLCILVATLLRRKPFHTCIGDLNLHPSLLRNISITTYVVMHVHLHAFLTPYIMHVCLTACYIMHMHIRICHTKYVIIHLHLIAYVYIIINLQL